MCSVWIFQVHKQGRLPSITWRHPSSRALLVRGSSYHHRGVMSIIRGSHANNTGQASDIPTSIEAEQYLAKIIDASPTATLKPGNDNNHNNAEVSRTDLTLSRSRVEHERERHQCQQSGRGWAGLHQHPDSLQEEQQPILQGHGGIRNSDSVLR